MIIFFEQLWNGQIAPSKTCGNNDPEVQELAELRQRNRADLENALSEEQNALLDRYIRCCEDYLYLIAVHAFRKGFCLAAKLFGEAVSEDVQ